MIGLSRADLLEHLGIPEHRTVGLGMVTSLVDRWYVEQSIELETGRYALEVFAKVGIDYTAEPLDSDSRIIQEGIVERFNGDELEFIALNESAFPVSENGAWNNWEPMDKPGCAHEEIYSCLMRFLQDFDLGGGRTLVVGCGQGRFLEVLKGLGCEPEGIDPNSINVEAAQAMGRNVQQMAVHELSPREKYDMIIDPGVFSALVVSPQYAREQAPRLLSYLKSGGMFIQVPYTPSWINSEILHDAGLSVLNRTVPRNLFGLEYPKQFYVGIKN